MANEKPKKRIFQDYREVRAVMERPTFYTSYSIRSQKAHFSDKTLFILIPDKVKRFLSLHSKNNNDFRIIIYRKRGYKNAGKNNIK